MKKQTLKLLDPAEDFILIGIASHEKDYKICWLLNNSLKLDFTKSDDLEFDDKKEGKKNLFCKFSFEDEFNRIQYFLLGNKNNANILLPQWKEMDYLLKIAGNIQDIDQDEIVKKLNSINTVQLAVSIDLKSLKTKDYLIFD
ncbi:MAG: IPExxxVDY family protein [Chitinophagales bacterium]|nr:IPExxxVDY family protein [Chitinophagales bacterium]